MSFLKNLFFLLLFDLILVRYIATEDGAIWFDEADDINNFSFMEKSRALPKCAYDSDEIVIRNKTCKIRGNLMKELEFKWRSSYDCFFYLQPSLRNLSSSPVQPYGCNFRDTMAVTCLLINLTSSDTQACFQVDESIPEVVREIRRTLISDRGVKKWAECSKNAMRCCENVLANDIQENGTCPAVWDAWSCWDKVPAGETSTGVCPEYAYSNTGPACHHFSNKVCQDNGTWIEKTDYGTCSVSPRLITRVNFHIGCLSISLIIAFPAVILLFAYRKLRVRRLALHRNLLIAIMVRNVLVIITKSTIIMEQLTSISSDTIMSRNEWPCKMLASLDKLAASATFTCMLVDGIFLHRMIVAVFKRELNIFMVHGIGAAATIIPAIIWMILMSTMNDSDCWIVYSVPNIQWTLDAPRLTMLAINIVLLIDIMRVLFTKLRSSENAHNLSTAKATLFLMPLFGVQFLITAWRPKTTSCDWEQAYYFFTYIMDGLQGIMVAMLYCYFNKEVHSLLRATYRKTENIITTRFRSEARRPMDDNMADRRETFLTMLDNQVPADNGQLGDCRSENSRSSIENHKTFSTFKPSIDAGINENEEEEIKNTPPFQETVNVVTLLSNPYTPTRDGFINLEFENDIYEGNDDNLRRSSDEQFQNENSIKLKPRIPRNPEKLDNDYQNFEVLTSCVKKNFDKGIDNDLSNNNFTTIGIKETYNVNRFFFDRDDNDLNNNSETPDVDSVIFLNRPLYKNDTRSILPDVCNVVPLGGNHGDDFGKGEEKTVNEKSKEESFNSYENLRFVPEFDDIDELEILDDIDPQTIIDEIQRKYDSHDYENLKVQTENIDPIKDTDVIYEDIVFDPQALRSNRRTNNEEDIVFV